MGYARNPEEGHHPPESLTPSPLLVLVANDRTAETAEDQQWAVGCPEWAKQWPNKTITADAQWVLLGMPNDESPVDGPI